MKTLPLLMLSLSSISLRAADVPPMEAHKVEFTVRNETLSQISPRLFGQFFERNFGEPGPEAGLTTGTNQLRPDIVAKLKEMEIPLIRFPGGTNIDYLDWRDLIDNVPGREGGRPVSIDTKGAKGLTITNRFGYDEYFKQVRDVTGCETDLVVNFLDAVAKRKPARQAAIDACGLLAYVNSPEGAKLPDGMPDWPAVRAKNGHPAPYGIQYIQIGNETWVGTFKTSVREALPGVSDVELAAHYHECLSEYIRVIREIDPKIPIIIDLRMPFGAAPQVYADPFILKNVSLMAYHVYQMGSMTEIWVKDKKYSANQFSSEDIWTYWTMTPTWSGTGLADHMPRDEPGLHAGLKLACTEWNWVRWGYDRMDPKPPFHWTLPAALGTARHLHGMIRAGDRLALGTQSMLLGSKWNFAAVFFDPEKSDPPHFSAQGQVMNLYRHTMGKELLKLDFTKGLETLTVKIPETTETMPAGAALDPIASKDGNRILIHIVNRYRDAPVEATIRFEGFGSLPNEGKLQTLSVDSQAAPDAHRDPLDLTTEKVSIAGDTGTFQLTRPGVYFIEIRLN